MALRTEEQMASLKRRTYGAVTLLGVAGTIFFTADTYRNNSNEVDYLTKCEQTVGAKERMDCAWQNPSVIKEIVADPRFDARSVKAQSDASLSAEVTDANVFITDEAIETGLAEAREARSDVTMAVGMVGLVGTLALNFLASIPLARREIWNGDAGVFYYE